MHICTNRFIFYSTTYLEDGSSEFALLPPPDSPTPYVCLAFKVYLTFAFVLKSDVCDKEKTTDACERLLASVARAY